MNNIDSYIKHCSDKHDSNFSLPVSLIKRLNPNFVKLKNSNILRVLQNKYYEEFTIDMYEYEYSPIICPRYYFKFNKKKILPKYNIDKNYINKVFYEFIF